MKRFILFFLFSSMPLTAHADLTLYLLLFKDEPGKVREAAFFPVNEGTSPKQCVEIIRTIKGGGTNDITRKMGQVAKGATFNGKCVKTTMQFSELGEEAKFVWLLRFVAGFPSITVMSSLKHCEEQRAAYESLAGRESSCVRSAQEILY